VIGATVLRGDLPGERRELRLRVGPFAVTASEIPGERLTAEEWADISLARRSYSMWGGDAYHVDEVDPFDGREPSSPYRAWHYRAWVRDGAEPAKLVVMRKVRLDPSSLSTEQLADPGDLLPLDVRLWLVDAPGGDVPLWQALRALARCLEPRDAHPEFRIASMGRIATFPHGEPKRTMRVRDRTAIAFAAMQLLACQGDSSLLHIWSLCPELRERVVGIRDLDGLYVAPEFRRTEESLGLPRGSVHLDNRLEEVRQLKASYPGYWLDNADAARILGGLLDEGRLDLREFADLVHNLISRERALGGDRARLEEILAMLATPDHVRLAEVLTSPRLFRYLIPLIADDQPRPKVPNHELRERLLAEAGDGPFSALVIPTASAVSAWAVLDAAAEKYREGDRPTRPTTTSAALTTSASTAVLASGG
jgi:hypothetical protein